MNSTSEMSQAALIRSLNDMFRRTFIDGRIVLTRSIMSLPPLTTPRGGSRQNLSF
jgi:hypothetical protein